MIREMTPYNYQKLIYIKLFNALLDSTLQGREARSVGTFSSLASLSLVLTVFHSTRDPTPDHVSPASDRSDGC